MIENNTHTIKNIPNVFQIIIKVILGSFHTEICQKYSNPNFTWWSDYWNVYKIIYLRGFIFTSFSVKIYLTLHQNTYYIVYIPETLKTLFTSYNSFWSRLHFFSIVCHLKPIQVIPYLSVRWESGTDLDNYLHLEWDPGSWCFCWICLLFPQDTEKEKIKFIVNMFFNCLQTTFTIMIHGLVYFEGLTQKTKKTSNIL